MRRLLAGYNFSLLLGWLEKLLRAVFVGLWRAFTMPCFA
jgi:hypothetical protein